MTKINFKTHFFSFFIVSFFVFIAFGSGGSDSSSSPKTPEDLNKELIEAIDLVNNFKGDEYKGSIYNLDKEIEVFIKLGKLIYNGENSENEENKKLAADLREKTIALQIKEFPEIRKEYGIKLGNKEWENDYYVSTQGKKNEIISLTNAFFASNRNIQKEQTNKETTFEKYRFKEVRYFWIKEDEEFTYYTMETLNDNEISDK